MKRGMRDIGREREEKSRWSKFIAAILEEGGRGALTN